MQFPDWVGKLSPFGHVSLLPIENVTFIPLFLLSVIAIGLMIINFVGFRKRDIKN